MTILAHGWKLIAGAKLGEGEPRDRLGQIACEYLID
jgi:hypothetical protein